MSPISQTTSVQKTAKRSPKDFFFKDLGNDLVFCLNLDKKYENHILHE